MELLLRCDGVLSGERNMALDRALLKSYQNGDLESPTLRVYRWNPPALSLGYHQSAAELDIHRLRSAGIDLVRRPSGGGAVLHWSEFTYAVAGPLGLAGIGGNFREVYASLASVLVETLNRLKIPARQLGESGPENFLCFASLQGHEISVGGRKLVGSAFRQTRRAFLQHGSLLTGPQHLSIVDFMGTGEESERAARKESLRSRTTNLQELGHGDLTLERFALGFAEALLERTKLKLKVLDAYPKAVLQHAASSRAAGNSARILP